jgi:predicted aspartyl protease
MYFYFCVESAKIVEPADSTGRAQGDIAHYGILDHPRRLVVGPRRSVYHPKARKRPSPIGRSKAMRTRGENGVGRFSVEIEIVNDADVILAQAGHLPADQIRRATIQGLVDSGATRLVLPEAVVKRLGLPLGDPVNVRYADGRRARRKGVDRVYLQLLGRHGTFTAICEPKRETALIGAIVLEDLDLLVDCVAQQVVPRDPSGATYEIE